MLQAIKSWLTGAVIWEGEIECTADASEGVRLGLAVRLAVKAGARLDGARLDGARLDGASLDGARLDGASLDGASLVRASLDGARLDGASLDGARLDGARLDGASLDGARLDGASLDGASLVRASLDGARLDGASLDGARLDGARLDGASLDGAVGVADWIGEAKADIFAALDACVQNGEAEFLLAKLEEGKVEGQTYGVGQECGCLLGTLATARGCKTENELPRKPDGSTPAEQFFYGIRPGHTPGNSMRCALAHAWVREWIATRRGVPMTVTVDSLPHPLGVGEHRGIFTPDKAKEIA